MPTELCNCYLYKCCFSSAFTHKRQQCVVISSYWLTVLTTTMGATILRFRLTTGTVSTRMWRHSQLEMECAVSTAWISFFSPTGWIRSSLRWHALRGTQWTHKVMLTKLTSNFLLTADTHNWRNGLDHYYNLMFIWKRQWLLELVTFKCICCIDFLYFGTLYKSRTRLIDCFSCDHKIDKVVFSPFLRLVM